MARESGSGGAPDRSLILAALIEVVAGDGYQALEIDRLLERAGLDRAAFDRHFSSLDDCFAATWDEIHDELHRRMRRAYRLERDDWRSALRSALGAALRHLSSHESEARLYFSEAVYAVDLLRHRQHRALVCMSATIDEGRRALPEPDQAPPQIADAIAGVIWSRVHQLVRLGHGGELQAQLPQLMYFAVMPYLGTAAAEEELRRPVSGG